MTYVSSDPAWWSNINVVRIYNCFMVASCTAVVYDWVLTFAQELELVWRQRWSFMTVLYMCVRYTGILYSVINILSNLPVSITDVGCTILWSMQAWMPAVVNAMLGVIMMTRIYAMYQRSEKMLIFLLLVWLASTIATAVMTVLGNIGVSAEEVVLSGNHICLVVTDIVRMDLNDEAVIPTAVWEILTLFLAVWIVIKRLRETRQLLPDSTIEDCFTVLIRSHVLYFVAFAAMSCFSLGQLSPKITYSPSVRSAIYFGVLQIAQVLEMFMLGPRLILNVRECHAKLVASSDEGTTMTTIAFMEHGYVSTSGGV